MLLPPRICYQKDLFYRLAGEDKTLYEGAIARMPTTAEGQKMFLCEDFDFRRLAIMYDEYFQGVLNGNLGPIAQFWGTYVYMGNRLYRALIKAVRTNDIVRYKEILPMIADVFFSTSSTR